MPFTIDIVEGSHTDIVGTGVIRIADLIELNDRLYGPLAREEVRLQYVDLTDVDHAEMSADDLKTTADQDTSAVATLGAIKIAVVAPANLTYGLSRMWQVFTGELFEAQVFRDRGEARRWLLG